MNSTNVSYNVLYRNCDYNLPPAVCVTGNISGFISATVWFLVLLPQVIYNFRRRSTEGLSLIWAIMNFTSALNHAFFVFKWGTLPLDDQISAVYMCVFEFLILIQFWLFTKFSKSKLVVLGLCATMWTSIISLQCFLSVYQWMEWISVTLWSIQTFPQVFLNFKRHSTLGLATGMVILTTVGKTTDFFSTYLLIMPVQFVVMCYFSSTVAFVETMQVIVYWKRLPHVTVPEVNTLDAEIPMQNLVDNSTQGFSNEIMPTNASNQTNTSNVETGINKWCQSLRIVLFAFSAVLLLIFAIGLIIRTATLLSVIAPIGTIVIVTCSYIYYYNYFSLISKILPNIFCSYV